MGVDTEEGAQAKPEWYNSWRYGNFFLLNLSFLNILIEYCLQCGQYMYDLDK